MSDPNIITGPDLDSYVESETATMTVRDPSTGEALADPDGTAWYIELYAPDSTAARQFERDMDRRRRARGKDREWTTAELREIALDRMTALTAGWHLRRGGQGVPCDADTVRAVYQRWPWLMKQAAAFANADGNFLSGESSPS